ncbi:autotransporter outer membrane beta-barrel domain-containing protein [Morganella psychrotolerans]|uniref:autotransporter outer membrane beta-barrel domain-containing protein n=1 Tax=Morganella psychrotolerans TaxID=368603 RepID=UPI0039B0BC02
MKKKVIALFVHSILFTPGAAFAESVTSPIIIGAGQEKNLVSGDAIDIRGSSGIEVDGGKLNMTDVTGTVSGIGNAGYGLSAINAGSINITGGEYIFSGNNQASTGILIKTGSSLNIDGAKLTGDYTGRIGGLYLLDLQDAGSRGNIKNSELTSTNGRVFTLKNGADLVMSDTVINIEGSGSDTVYSMASQNESTFTGERLTVISDANYDSGSSVFLAHKNLSLKDSSITSNLGQTIFTAGSRDGGIYGDNLVINYRSQKSDGAQGNISMHSTNGGTIDLTNSELNVSGDNAAVAVFITADSHLVANGMRLNAEDNAQAIQIQGNNAGATFSNSYITTADKEHGVLFAYGASGLSGNASSLILDNTVLKSDKWALRSLDGGSMVNVSGAGSHVSGDKGAIYIDALNADSDMVFNLSDNARLTGDAYTIDKNGYKATLNLNLSQNAVWNGNVLTHDKNSLANVFLKSGSVWKGAVLPGALAPGGGTTHISVDDAYWELTDDSAINSLSLANNATVALGAANGKDFRVLSVNDLSGSGEFILRTDLSTTSTKSVSGDVLKVTGSTDGSHTLNVLNNGSADTNGTEKHSVVETADGNGSFSLKNKVELGGYVYELKQDGNNWALYAPGGQSGGGDDKPVISEGGRAPISAVNAGYLLNIAETQTLSQRMGELRDSQSEGDVWIRGFGGGFNSRTSNAVSDFNSTYGGTQAGIDKRLVVEGGSLYFGAMAGLVNADQDYKTGNGSVKNYHLGLYSTYVHQSGFYIDSLIKFSDLTYDFGVSDTAGYNVRAKTSSNYYATSVEAGQRFHFNQKQEGLYIEPQVQLTYGYQEGTDFNESNGLQVRVDSYQSLQSRAGINMGYDVKSGPMPLNMYAKLSYIKEHKADVDFRLNNTTESESFGDKWLLAGIGVSAQVSEKQAFYIDMEKANSDKYGHYRFNAGYRFSF